MKIHYSELDAYLACPAAYKRRYIDCVKDEQESSALHVGTALHLAINTHFEGGNPYEVFNIYWDSVKNLNMVYYRHDWNDLRVLANEQWLPKFIRLHASKYLKFEMEQLISAPLFTHPKYGEIHLEGTFDMFSMYDDVSTMTDWKTSSREYKADKIIKNPQLYIYSYMYMHNYGPLPAQIQYKVFRKDNGGIQTLTHKITQEDLNKQIKNVTDVIKLMLYSRENDVFPHSFNCYCKENE